MSSRGNIQSRTTSQPKSHDIPTKAARQRNNLRANDFFTRRINGGGANPNTCGCYVIDEALVERRPTNAAIDTGYPALGYTPGGGQVVALNP